MKSSGSKEQVEIKQKYVFFSDPETIAKRAERPAGILQNQQLAQLRKEQSAKQLASGILDDPPSASNLKNIETFLVYQPVKPYPFTFITAVKRKLALAAYDETKKLYSGNCRTVEPLDVQTNKVSTSSRGSLYQAVQEMEFIKPLKVPDVKILPKTLDYSSKDTSNLRDLTPQKFSMTSQKVDKTPKSVERAQRKLDFSLSEGHSLISSDDIEPLKVPDLSISPSLLKKKDNIRDSSREKENRAKGIKKDDSSIPKVDDQDCSKRTKNPKHVSRKDVADPKRSKNERTSSHLPKERDFTSKKPKNKNFATSTAKKDDEKRLRSSSIHSTKTSRDRSLESRGRTFSSESLSDRNFKSHEKIVRDSSRATDSDASALKYNDDYEILNAVKQLEEQKHKVMENKPPKMLPRSSQPTQQKPLDVPGKEQHKRILDRTKASTSKSQARAASSTSEIFEEIETVSDSNSNKNRSVYTETLQQSKAKNPGSSNAQANSNIESKNITQVSSDEIVLDPTRISFRDDSYSQQDEFYDLVTPDINLTIRSKRRKPIAPENDSETELKMPKHKPTRVETPRNTGVPLVHPTALHMQFQAELHLFDSYNESLRQVMDVEKCLYTVNHDKGKELLQKQRLANDEISKQFTVMEAERDTREVVSAPFSDESPDGKALENDNGEKNALGSLPGMQDLQEKEEESRNLISRNKDSKPDVKVAEVQTQTANDIATQTETRMARHTVTERLKQYPTITYDRGSLTNCGIPEFSLGSLEQFEDLDHIEDISMPSKMRTMSEISLHETTSSIKTETGTEISISTRDVTCSFNKNLDLEMAQLIKDEKLMYDKIEMLFRSREKTLNDRTRKLVKLEEEKRALRDTGQDSRISSVKKKQRALLLKLQQEKDEMNQLKELHKMASQERKLMLQKQRNMFNPQMSTKNILTKLKRSADCQSPRRLSGPMKGYDIRSNSSMSSLVDSDKSQLDRSQIDLKLQLSDSSHRLEGKSLKSDLETSAADKLDPSKNPKYMSVLEESANSLNNLDQLDDFISSFEMPQNLESKASKFEEKMPSLKTNYLVRPKHTVPLSQGQIVEITEGSKIVLQNVENSENVKSESDTLVEELSKKSKSQAIDAQVSASLKDKESATLESIHGDMDSINTRKSKASQVTEESLLINHKGTKKSEKVVTADRDATKKSQHESKSANKRKGSKNLKAKSTSNILTENILRSKGNTHIVDDIIKPVSKRTKGDKEPMQPDDNYQSSILEELDLNESQNSLQALVKHPRAVKDKNYKLLRDIASEHETKENMLTRNVMERSSENRENNSRREDPDIHNLGNISTRSQVSTFTISRHSSGDSEKSFSRSVVIRAQDHGFKTSKKLEQVLNAREAALTTRRNCVEDWIAWHTKLKAEESRVARMEQAAFKLVSTTSNVLPYHDTTMSSDTSDVEGRVELLAEKLAEKRAEMAKLKREARRQAKQRLKALEANLLSQIKKYDTTIHEMRKKLETQKIVIKDSDKLAIESRSVADFKVPEIPMKRIQEIYKSSDLLRSRSESDLIFSKASREDASTNVYAADNQGKSKDRVYKSSSSLDNKSSRVTRLSSAREGRTNQSAESVLEETKNFTYGNSEKHSEVSSRESQRVSESRSEESAAFENVSSLRNSATSAVDGLESVHDRTNTRKSEATEIEEISEAAATDENSKIFSRKLETLQLTNKNLNDDISTLENDLKALSEMMSHFSKKSDDKLKFGSAAATEHDDIVTVVDSVDKSTLKDISEQLSQSVHSEQISKPTEDLDLLISMHSGDAIPEESSISQEIEKYQTSGGYPEELQPEVTQVMSAIITDGLSSESKTTEEIDFEARSKEILNVIEKSIISEHVKSPVSELNVSRAALVESMKDMHEENEALSQDLNSLEGDIKSISKIISEMAESKRNLGLAADLSEAAYTFGDSLEPREHTFDMPVLQLENENEASAISEHESRDGVTENYKFELQAVNSSEQSSEVEDKSARVSSRRESPVESASDILAKNKARVDASIIIDANIPDESRISVQNDEDEAESIAEELSTSQQDDYLYNESSVVSRKSNEASQEEKIEHDRTNESSLENSANDDNEEFKETEGISIGKASLDNDWTISDSFQVPDEPEAAQRQWEESVQPEADVTIEPTDFSPMNLTEESRGSPANRRDTQNFTCDMDDVSMFIPKGESTTIGYKFEDSVIDVTKKDPMHTDELDDILDIIARESKQMTESYREQEPEITSPVEDGVNTDREQLSGVPAAVSDRIVPRPSDLNLTAEVEPVLQKLTEILQGVERNIARRRKSGTDADSNRENAETKEPAVSPMFTSESVHTSTGLSAETKESDEKTPEIESYVAEEIMAVDQRIPEDVATLTRPARVDIPEEIQTTEIASQENLGSLRLDSIEDFKSSKIAQVEIDEEPAAACRLIERTFEIFKGPEYEDISEESLEVSEILDRSESQRSLSVPKAGKIPDKYEITQKSEDVLRILDAISQQSYVGSTNDQHLHDVNISVQVFGSISPGFSNKKDSATNGETAEHVESAQAIATLNENLISTNNDNISFNEEEQLPEGIESLRKYSCAAKAEDEVCRKEQDRSSESSEGADTPRGVSEIDLDSPRDPNESRLDIDALDDDLLGGNEVTKPDDDGKVDFHVAPVIATSEKDIEMMIGKLKASLEQPGLEVAELEAKLLRIEQLQIELEIKKLEAEEVSFYVREIPNKPPPPYTPPGGGSRLSTPQVSPTLPPAVVPSNVEELTAFTEKATVLIYNAKNAGEDIMSLQPPPEICELSKDNETVKQDRRIYNTFLFDLCKETIAELYRSEYEKPGPSWTKPNVKTKPAMKIPKTVEELNEYVSKEVATLFGFKTKLQRENMVMRWSRKRRDRVDELLAREAQAEEDEWTKFHHDELAVKNELTVAILDTLILETANVVKAVYAKKRKVMA